MSLSKVGKDFGCGFYLSPDREQAEKMAAKKAEQIHCDTPCVTEFECDEPSMKSELEELKFKKGITFLYFFATEKSIKYLERV